MPHHAPATELATHEVANHPGPDPDRNLYATNMPLLEAVRRNGSEWLDQCCSRLGGEIGTETVRALGEDANDNPPVLESFDRYGRRLDEVKFHPAYHQLMAIAMRHGIHDVAWNGHRPGGHVAHAALLAIFTEVEAGTMCPINMTYAAVPALRRQPDIAGPYLDRLIGGHYDAPLAPIAGKQGITVGMAMTEKQGGSDVRANTTQGRPLSAADRLWQLSGHKWFCSAPMSDAFLTLAQTPRGLSCFVVPRITASGRRNAIQLMRLKRKLGNRSNASAEIEYHGAEAHLVGEEGRGIPVILEMVHHTRLGTIAATLGVMRAALAEAIRHTSGRRAFGSRLIDQPAMRSVLADLALDYEAAACLVMRVARAFDGETAHERDFARLSVAVAKYWLTKRCPNFVYECMECVGGGGYVDESPMPRLFRESPLNAIWEGSGNVIALDIRRTLSRAPDALAALKADIATARGPSPVLDANAASLLDRLSARTPIGEADARMIAERIALVLTGTLVLRETPHAVSDAWLESRLSNRQGVCYGTLPAAANRDAILARQ